jgi:hypothetical protein
MFNIMVEMFYTKEELVLNANPYEIDVPMVCPFWFDTRALNTSMFLINNSRIVQFRSPAGSCQLTRESGAESLWCMRYLIRAHAQTPECDSGDFHVSNDFMRAVFGIDETRQSNGPTHLDMSEGGDSDHFCLKLGDLVSIYSCQDTTPFSIRLTQPLKNKLAMAF